jgi:hypothetical protein
LADLENPDSELRKTMANLKPLHYVWETRQMIEQRPKELLVQSTE